MAQLALYRKYRSQSFEDLIGQEHVVKTLQSALNTNRVAQTFLFTGPRGTGKTSSARLLAKALNCEAGPSGTPCNACDHCKMITLGSHPDVVEMDAASDSGVEDVREKIVEVVSYAPMMARTKVFIIDEVHDLSAKAFDALLKTIEEPPAHLVFILATTEYTKVPATIRSRCQKFEFHRATLKNLTDRLTFVCESEQVKFEPAAISAIARMADGGFRDALTLLEQAMLVSDGEVTLNVVYDQLGLVNEEAIDRLLFAIQGGEIATVIEVLETVIRSGRDPKALLESMLYRLADLTRVAFAVKSDEFDSVRESSLHDVATRMGRDYLVSIRSTLAEAHKVIRDISLPRLWLESEFIRLSMSGSGSSNSRAARPAQVATSVPVAPTPKSTTVPQPTPNVVREESIVIKPVSDTIEQVEVSPSESVAKVINEPQEPVASNVENTEPVDLAQGMPELETSLNETQQEKSIWDEFLSKLPLNPKTGGATPHAIKLINSILIQDTGDKLIVEIDKEIHHQWFYADVNRIKFLADQLHLIGREGTQIELVAEKKNDVQLSESEAVELPLSGTQLEQSIRREFGLDAQFDK